MKMNDLPALSPTREEMERAFARKDAGYDGVFYVAVKTTGIFCRPSCPSRPNLENVEFFLSVKDCLFAGYRPCKRCHPLEANGKPPEWAQELISRVEAAPDARLKAADLRALGITPERARRWFQAALRHELRRLVPGQSPGRGVHAHPPGRCFGRRDPRQWLRISQRLPGGVHSGVRGGARPQPRERRPGSDYDAGDPSRASARRGDRPGHQFPGIH